MTKLDLEAANVAGAENGADAVRRRVNILLYGIDTARRVEAPKTRRVRSEEELDELLDALWQRAGTLLARKAA
jgi:hypothetical protein